MYSMAGYYLSLRKICWNDRCVGHRGVGHRGVGDRCVGVFIKD